MTSSDRTEGEERQVMVRVPRENVVFISDEVALVKLGTAEDVMRLLLGGISNPGKAVVLRKEGDE